MSQKPKYTSKPAPDVFDTDNDVPIGDNPEAVYNMPDVDKSVDSINGQPALDDDEPVAAPKADDKSNGKDSAFLNKITHLAGVKSEDVLSHNVEHQTIVTKQGGKYKLSATGKLLHLAGPAPKSAESKADEQE